MATNTSPFPPKSEKRSPFPRKSLPQAGESLQDAAFDLVFGKFVAYLSVAVTVAAVAAYEFVMGWLHIRVTPWLWLYGAVFMGALATWQYFRHKPQLAALRQAIRGEREVGRMLEELRAVGYTVFHDIPGDGFNVDHALIGPAGVFAIETKTISKPLGRRAQVAYDGKRVLLDGKAPDRDPIAQAKAVADHLRDIFKRMADRDVAVRPVVVYPGWWVDPLPAGAHVWVLNPKALKSFLEKEPKTMSREDVALLAERLTLRLSDD